jgi:hypothetical protein
MNNLFRLAVAGAALSIAVSAVPSTSYAQVCDEDGVCCTSDGTCYWWQDPPPPPPPNNPGTPAGDGSGDSGNGGSTQ